MKSYYERKRLVNRRVDFDALMHAHLAQIHTVIRALHTYNTHIISREQANIKLLGTKENDDSFLARQALTLYKLLRKSPKRSADVLYHEYKKLMFVNGGSVAQKSVNKQLDINDLDNKVHNISKIITQNRSNIKLYSPFFMSTVVLNCAEDHIDYQGRLYYDKDFTLYIKSKDLINKVKSYIRKNKLLSIQYVTTNKPYLTTRPHCRHTFRNVDINDVLGESKLSQKDIVLKYNNVLKQIPPISYEERMFLFYRRKLEELTTIRKELRCKEIERDILSTASLMRKWKRLASNS